MEKHVCDLEISMDDIFFSKIIQSFKNIFDDGFSLVLIKVSLFSQSGLKVSFTAKFCYYIAVPVAGKDLVAFEYIGMVQFF
jgi:hypothetical protein